MSERIEGAGFPERDGDGRITRLSHLLGIGLAGVVVGVLALVVFDWGFATIGAGRFGHANGWLAAVLPAWLYLDDFRAWDRGVARVVAALFAAALGILAGLLAAAAVAGLPALWSGGLAAAVFAIVYALIWFVGVRWLRRRTG
ncbi:hypothetical protein [Plantactinospora sp. KBS50]|uniref:hypothetical protein n=1 Tax=Plantactinospora sp. KBS50 TaxID=2024580 RepID=UPI000BAAFF6F|nr:hypothetical protein [Plantactinospora sp. KBS50]ASW53196.1 hypothetical protein CIK06_01890 [Plantactinospora sp. KBS50]